MSTNELNTLARDLKELRLMAEQLDAEIKALEDAIKAHMTEHAVDTLITTDHLAHRHVQPHRHRCPEEAAARCRRRVHQGDHYPPVHRPVSGMTHKGEARESFPFSSFWLRTHDYRRTRK